MSADKDRSAAGQAADKAAMAVIGLIMRAAIAAGPVAEKLLGVLDARDARRARREGDAS